MDSQILVTDYSFLETIIIFWKIEKRWWGFIRSVQMSTIMSILILLSGNVLSGCTLNYGTDKGQLGFDVAHVHNDDK